MDTISSYLESGFYFTFALIVLLGVLIFVHELGHFLVARWCGVRVEVFSLGFGKKIFKYKKDDTVYAISVIPLGGYVKMFGEQPGSEITEAEKAVSFTHKTVWQRIAIVAAGPLMNFFFAVLIFSAIAFIGEDASIARVGDVPATTAAYESGLRSGDHIRMINDELVATWDDVQKKLNKHKGSQIQVQVQREPQLENLNLTLDVAVRPNGNLLSFDTEIGELEGVSTLSTSAVIGVTGESKLRSLGMKTGDRIVSINGEKIRFLRELEDRLSQLQSNTALTFDIERAQADKKELEKLTLTFAGFSETGSSGARYSMDLLGLESINLYIQRISPGAPADKAGLQSADRIVAINDKPVTEWMDVINGIKSFDGTNPIKMDIARDGEILKKTLTPQMTSQLAPNGADDKRFTIGITTYDSYSTYDPTKISTRNPLQAVAKSFVRTWDYSAMTLISFVRLIENKISPKNIGGIISIGQAASATFQMGYIQFLQMMALISINLFVLNLLPIPVLDGGHLVAYFIEAVKGSPVNLRKLEYAQQIGIFLLVSLMVFALYNDFSRLLGG